MPREPSGIDSNHLHDLLAKKLRGFDRLAEDEVDVLRNAIGGTRSYEANWDLVAPGESPVFSTLLISGWAARYKNLEDGSRQITAIHVAGDFVDLHSFLLRPMDHGVTALSACMVAMVPHEKLQQITERYPHLTRVLWLSTLVDAALHREWLVAMGRLPTVARLAHLICELYVRLDTVGLIENKSFEFPVTQGTIADMLGLSIVHVNRAVQDIRSRGFLTWTNKIIQILDWEGLKSFARFDPSYLHQVRRP